MSNRKDDGDTLKPGTDIRPQISLNESSKLFERLYGLECLTISELNAYDDKNYKINAGDTSINEYIDEIHEDGYVLKIINSLDSKKTGFIDAQTKMMQFLRENNFSCPVPVKNKHGEYFSTEKISGKDHVVRLLEYQPGKIFLELKCDNDLLYQTGEYAAKLDMLLKNFHHSAYEDHKTLWMLSCVPKLRDFLFVIKDEKKRSLTEVIIRRFEKEVLTKLNDLEEGIIHGDLNEQNIVVNMIKDTNGEDRYVISSVLDFGDTQKSYLLFELAILVAYMILQSKSLSSGKHVLKGYSKIRIIPKIEYDLLQICIAARLIQSLVLGAYSYEKDPTNHYVLTTQANGWKILERLMCYSQETLHNLWRFDQ